MSDSSGKKDWLANLKAGDEVARSAGFSGYLIAQVDRVTPTQVIISNCRYSKKDGCMIGSSGYDRSRILQLTAPIRKEIEFNELVRWANAQNWSRSTIAQLRAMRAAHDAAEVKS